MVFGRKQGHHVMTRPVRVAGQLTATETEISAALRASVAWERPYVFVHLCLLYHLCLQCFGAVGWAAGRASGLKKISGECWHGYLSGARCRLAYGPADATATHCLLFQYNPHWFYLSGTGSPG